MSKDSSANRTRIVGHRIRLLISTGGLTPSHVCLGPARIGMRQVQYDSDQESLNHGEPRSAPEAPRSMRSWAIRICNRSRIVSRVSSSLLVRKKER